MSDTPAPIFPPERDNSTVAPGPSLAALLLDQRRRWPAGERMLVEHYVERRPGLRDDAAALLDLIYNEVVLREQHGEAPGLDEYVQRFPSLAGPLRLQFAMDRALGREAPAPSGASSDARATVRIAAPAPAAPEMPSVAGYEMLGVLGKGGMGVAYKAWHAPLKRVVALKMIRAGDEAGPDELARFRTEAEAVGRLQHPNIVQVFEVGLYGSRPYLALEYLEGGSLDALLNGTPWPARQAAGLVQTLARAVQHAHERGVLHRDLKPANVLLAADSTPKIADFGLAKLVMGGASQTQSDAILGTPSYMAPEQAGGRAKQVGPTADVYALGAILYELLTGRPPFKAATPLETLLQVRTEEPVPPARLQPKTPRDLETIALKCLPKDPARRYASAGGLADDLGRFLAGEPIRARAVGRLEHALKWARRRPAAAALIAVILTALASVTGLWRRADRLREVAETKRAEAEAANKEALAYFGLASEAVDEYSRRISGDRRLREADLYPLRRTLLEAGVPFYQRLARREGMQGAMRAEQAKAHERLGRLSHDIGSPQEAVAHFQEAIRAFDELVGQHPEEAEYRKQLAIALHNLAMTYSEDLRRPEDAEPLLERSVQLRERLAGAHPEVADYQHGLALSVLNQAGIHAASGRLDLAGTEFRRTVEIYERLVGQNPGTAAYKQGLALSLTNLGRLREQRGPKADAQAEYQRAVALQEELVREHPGDPEYPHYLARYYTELGRFYKDTGRAPLAQEALRKAIDTLTGLTETHRSVLAYERELAATRQALGDLHVELRQTAEAADEYKKAVALLEGQYRRQPNVPEARFALVRARQHFSVHLGNQNQRAEALGELRKALDVLEPPGQQDTMPPEYRALLGHIQYSMAFELRAGGKAEEALAWYGRSLSTITNLPKRDRESPSVRHLLLSNHWDRAAAFMKLARHNEALADWDRALTFADGPLRTRLRSSRAVVLAHLGEHAQAAAEAEELARAESPEPLVLLHAADTWALAAVKVRDDGRLPQAEREQRSEQYARQSIELLRRLHRGGYFKTPAGLKDLRKDKDLDAVRSREEFKKLLAEVEAPAGRE